MLRLVTIGLLAFGLGGLANRLVWSWANDPQPPVRMVVRLPVRDAVSGVGRASSVLTRVPERADSASSVGSAATAEEVVEVESAAAEEVHGIESAAEEAHRERAERLHAAAEKAVSDIQVEYVEEVRAATTAGSVAEVAFEFNEAVYADRRRRLASFLRRLVAGWCRVTQPAEEIYLRK